MAELTLADLLQARDNEIIDAANEARMRGRLLPGARGPEMRSTNTSLGDYLAQKLDSPAVGAAASKAERAGRTVMDVGSELTMVPQAIRTGNAVGEAALDPSIANVTNAGVNVGMTALRPAAALKALGAGYAAAGAKDAGLFDGFVGEANAQSAGQRRAEAERLKAESGRLQAEGAAAAAKAQAEADLMKAKTEAERQAAEQRKAEADAALRRAEDEKNAALQRSQKEKAAEDYRQGISRAEEARQKALNRDKRFSDTEMSKVYDKTAGWTPFLAGVGGGAAYRAVKGPQKGFKEEWLYPAAAGLGPGEAAAHAPSWYNAHMTEPDNPILRGNEEFANVAPDGPERTRALNDAERLRREQPTNPVHDAGQKEFYGLGNILERSLMGAFQGATGGKSGALAAALPAAAGRGVGSLVEGAASLQGRAQAGVQKGIAASEAERAGADAARLRANSVARDAAQSDQDLQKLQQQLQSGQQRQGRQQQRVGEADLLAPAESTPVVSSSQQGAGTSGGPIRPPQTAQAPAQQPAPGASSNQLDPSLGSTLQQGGNNGAITPPSQGQMLTLDPSLMDRLEKLLAGRGNMPESTVRDPTRRMLPSPADTGRGAWAETIQPTARDVLLKRADAGGGIEHGTAAQIGRDIDKALPPPTKRPSESDNRTRVSNLRGFLGDKPSRAELENIFNQAPDSIYKGKKIPAIAGAATAGTAATGASSDKADAAVGDEVVKRMVNGKSLEDMTPAELRNSGMSDDEIGPALDRVRKKAGTRENGRTAADQIRAIRDPSSPTGHRAANGQFVAAP